MHGTKILAILALMLASAPSYASEDCNHMLQLAIDAAVGEPTAQYNLAVEHWRGECVEKDLSISRNLWEKAADAGMADAYNNYGYLLYYGLGGEPNLKGAVRSWRRGRDLGSYEAMIHLAQAHLDGLHLRKNANKAKILATAAKECASLDGSETHIDMAEELLTETGDQFSAREKREVTELVALCTGTKDPSES